MKKKNTKKGFTLIELIVVLAILAIIGAIAIPQAFGALDKARQQADQATVSSINSTIRMYVAVHNTPTELAGKTVNDCLKESNMPTPKFQSPKSVITWVPGDTVGDIGYYVWSVGNGNTIPVFDNKNIIKS